MSSLWLRHNHEQGNLEHSRILHGKLQPAIRSGRTYGVRVVGSAICVGCHLRCRCCGLGLAWRFRRKGEVLAMPAIHRVRIGKVTFRRKASSRYLAEFNATTNRLRGIPAGKGESRG